MRNPHRPSWLRAVATLLCAAGFLATSPTRAENLSLRQQAQQFERQGRWLEACSAYDELLSRDRNQPEVRDAYRRCLRHFRQNRRIEDVHLQSVLARLSLSEALDLYDHALTGVVANYVERDKIDLTTLFREGLQEMRAALEEKAFFQKYLTRVGPVELNDFRQALDELAGERVTNRAHAKALVRKIVNAAAVIRLRPGMVALEVACGACNSLDEYSLYLAPGRFAHAQTALKGKLVGIGVELTVVGQKVEIARVLRKSPAAEAGLIKGDRLLRINGLVVDPLALDLALERLMGELGTSVELDVLPRGQSMVQTVKIERQAVFPASVDAETRGEMGNYIGCIRIHQFQESTVQEVKDALASWQGIPMRGVVLDLRGNPGGSFKSGLAVAELFLPPTILAHTHSQHRDFNRVYRSYNANPFLLPMIVLVDGETASAAEVLAGALKENGRAELAGQPTFGKSSIQVDLPLGPGPGGLRLTVARFTSPSRQPYSGRGLVPDHPILDLDGDLAIRTAELRLLGGMGMMGMMNTAGTPAAMDDTMIP